MLIIDGLTKNYGKKCAVDNISLQVEGGQICAFIGHNGAGKTTTLKAIAGIIDFENGSIYVDGIDVKKQPLQSKKLIGYLPDNPDVYENLTGIDYLNFICDVFEVGSEDRKFRIEDYCKRFKILENLNQPISSYSHGMKQKIAIISMLVHKPKLYLLDEPFVGLDPTSTHELKQIMQEEVEQGNAIFYSTHVLEVAEKLCSHIVIIKNGKIMGSGSMKAVKGDKSLEKLFLELENDAVENNH